MQGLIPGANGQIQVVGKGGLVRWQSFNVSPGELFQVQGSSNQVLLNFVRGTSGASLIGGTVQSGPRFVLVNPSGIQVEASGRILAPSSWLVPLRLDPSTLWRFSQAYAIQPTRFRNLSFIRDQAINLRGTILGTQRPIEGSLTLLPGNVSNRAALIQSGQSLLAAINATRLPATGLKPPALIAGGARTCWQPSPEPRRRSAREASPLQRHPWRSSQGR